MTKRIKIIVPIPMDEAGVANRAEQIPPEMVEDGFEVSFDPLHCPRCPDTALTTIADKQSDTSVRFCSRCQGSWMTAEDFAGIVSALTTELDNRTAADYARESLRQAADLVKNKEDPISDWKDLKAVLRLLKFRFFVENPKLDAVMKGFQKSLPL